MWASKTLTDLYFANQCLQCFIEDCLRINGEQSTKVEKGAIEYKIILKKYQLHLKFLLVLSVI